jgi:hypothetical protein
MELPRSARQNRFCSQETDSVFSKYASIGNQEHQAVNGGEVYYRTRLFCGETALADQRVNKRIGFKRDVLVSVRLEQTGGVTAVALEGMCCC